MEVTTPISWNYKLRMRVVRVALYSNSASFMPTQILGPSEGHSSRRTSGIQGGPHALQVCSTWIITVADEPACRAEDVGDAEDGLVAVDTDRRDVDHLALLDRDRLDPSAISTTDGVTEGADLVLLNDFLVTGCSKEHGHRGREAVGSIKSS